MVAKNIHVDYNMQNNKITNLGAPSAADDAATKTYVDTLIASAAAGLSWKDSVRVATTAAGTLASSFENGDTVDGVALVTGNRILIKNQAAPEENGIYVVQASGSPLRATDADTASELLQSAVFVEEGTVNADKAFVMTTDAPITVNTTGLTFTPFGTGGGSSLTVQEEDGAPSDAAVTLIKVPNGKLVDNGVGDVSLRFGGLTLIEEHVVPAGGEASWTSAAIAAGYNDLQVFVEGRCEGAVVSDDVSLRFNSDSGANYDYQAAVFNNATFYSRAAAATSAVFGWLTGASGGANNASRSKVTIYSYDRTFFFKGFTSECGLVQGGAAGDIWSRINSGQWRSTAAITTITIFALGGSDLAEGTTIRIYGVK